MSRHTQSALEKRMFDLLQYQRRFILAVLGDDDQASQMIRRNFSAGDFDLTDPAALDRVLEQLDRDLVSIFSSPADYPLRGNPGLIAAQRERKAQAHRDLRAYQQQQLLDDYDVEQSWLRTGIKARADYPEFYAYTAGYDWKKLQRIWSRSPR
jgi:hypothetical protein